jgi:hypothetical protein
MKELMMTWKTWQEKLTGAFSACEAGIRVLVLRGKRGTREEINKTEAKERTMKATHPMCNMPALQRRSMDKTHGCHTWP